MFDHFASYVLKKSKERFLKLRARYSRNAERGTLKAGEKEKLRKSYQKFNTLYNKVKIASVSAGIMMLSDYDLALAQSTNPGTFNLKRRAANPLRSSLSYPIPSPSTVDLDNDGDFDVLVGTKYGEVVALVNEGTAANPVFSASQEFTPPYLTLPSMGTRVANSAVMADIDKDGDLDFFASNSGPSARYYRNDGGTFSQQVGAWNSVAKTGNPLEGISAYDGVLHFSDFDKDGDLDLFASDTYSSNIRYYRNDGAGNFSLHPLTLAPAPASRISGISTGDIDKDGDIDLLIAEVYGGTYSGFTGEVSLYKNNGADQFSESVLEINIINGDLNYTRIALVDLDNDTDLDLILGTGNYDSNKYSGTYSENNRLLYFENTAGVFTKQTGPDSPVGGIDDFFSGSEDNNYPNFVDVDLDGDLDAFISSNITYFGEVTELETVIDFFRNDNGEFKAEPNLFNLPTIPYRGTPYFVDLDKDGDLDFILKYTYSESLGLLYFKNEGGTFTETSHPIDALTFSTEVSTINLTDIDNDGDLDLIAAEFYYSYSYYYSGESYTQLRYFKNTGTNASPVYSESVGVDNPLDFFEDLTLNLPRAFPKLADIDNDGDFDLAATYTLGVFYLENTGTPLAPVYSPTIKPLLNSSLLLSMEPVFADIDDDGDTDMFLPTQYGSDFKFIRNENPVPVLVTGQAQTPDFVFGGSPIEILPQFLLSDTDNDLMVEATLTLSGFTTGEDVISYTTQSGITGSFDPLDNSKFILKGKATAAQYQAAIRSIKYSYVGSKPSEGGRVSGSAKTLVVTKNFNVSVLDSDKTTPVALLTSVSVIFPNSAPILAGSTPTVAFNASPIAIGQALTTSDADDANLEGATVAITTGLVSSEDQLVFTSQNGIGGNYSAASGVLTLTGISSVANYQTALRSVRYNNSATAPTLQTRSVSFSITDGETISNVLSIDVTVTPTGNTPPVINVPTQSTQIGNIVTINLAPLVSDPENNIDLSSLQIISQPISNATASITAASELILDYSDTDFAGTDQLTIEVCDLAGACSQGIITITVEGDVIVYNGFSPNGDTKNPTFRIGNITTLEPQNKVSIFNRWGDLVFEIDNYNNDSNKFDGRNNNGNELPSGTYFYRIQFTGSSNRESLTGYLTIKK